MRIVLLCKSARGRVDETTMITAVTHIDGAISEGDFRMSSCGLRKATRLSVVVAQLRSHRQVIARSLISGSSFHSSLETHIRLNVDSPLRMLPPAS